MNKEDKEFILENLDKDISPLLFKYHQDSNKRFLINQIAKRQKIKNKLSSFYKNFDFIFPINSKSIEQCSSEISAITKSKYFKGENFIDLSGGLGIDFNYISKNFTNSIYNDLDEELFELAKQNYHHHNNSFYNEKAEVLLSKLNTYFDLIYIDPDRRDNSNKKLFKLEELKPNILEILPKLKYKNLLIKLSPMFEINEFPHFFRKYNVWIISINGEVKELLLHLSDEITENKIKIISINNNNVAEYNYDNIQAKSPISNEEFNYLFEPDPAIIKAHLQDTIAIDNKLFKINHNTQYLFSNDIIPNLPGDYYKISQKLNYNTSDFKTYRIDSGIIKIRNFDDTLPKIKTKLGISENNKQYLFFTKDYNNKNVCFICEKLKIH